MGSDRTENEPDEYDPEAEFRDPDSDSITIPKVSTEDAGSNLRSDLASEHEDETDLGQSIGEADVSSDLLTAFWSLVIVINVAVLAYALGLLFLVFEGEVRYAAYLVGTGIVLTGFIVRRYRTVKRTEFSSSTNDGESGDEASDGTDTEAGAETDGEPDDADEMADDTDGSIDDRTATADENDRSGSEDEGRA